MSCSSLCAGVAVVLFETPTGSWPLQSASSESPMMQAQARNLGGNNDLSCLIDRRRRRRKDSLAQTGYTKDAAEDKTNVTVYKATKRAYKRLLPDTFHKGEQMMYKGPRFLTGFLSSSECEYLIAMANGNKLSHALLALSS